MAYREVPVTSATPVNIQLPSDANLYNQALLSVNDGTIRLVTDAGTPTASFGKKVFAGQVNFPVNGAGNVKVARMIAESTTATVGIELVG